MPKETQDTKQSKMSLPLNPPKGLVRDVSPGDDGLKVKKRLFFVLIALGVIIVSLVFLYGDSQREKKAREEHEQTMKAQEEDAQKEPIVEETATSTATSSDAFLETETPEPEAPKVVITDTPTGWLNVRSGPGTNYSKEALVYPGESHTLLTESENWYKIELKDGKEGWIYSMYAEKQ